MPAKSLKFCVSPTTKWRSCKIFAKLNRNHLLTANIFKIHKYQTFGRMKMHNMSTTWFANNKFKCYEILLHHKCFRSTHFRQWNDCPFKIFRNIYRNVFCFFFFVNEKKYCNLPFYDKFKMHYCTLCFLNEAYVKNFMKKQSIFNTNFNNSFEDVVYYKKLGYQNLWHFEYKAKFDKKDCFI